MYIDCSDDNIIGGTTVADRNIISGNAYYGIAILGDDVGCPATGNSVLGNFIGIKKDGATALPNQYGVYMEDVADSIIGGSATYAGNVISGNTLDNVYIGK